MTAITNLINRSDDQQNANGLTRRDFIKVGAAGATGVTLVGLATTVFAETGDIGKLPRRRYGRTGLEISALRAIRRSDEIFGVSLSCLQRTSC